MNSFFYCHLYHIKKKISICLHCLLTFLQIMGLNNINFKLLPLNARGIRSFDKTKTIFNWLCKSGADICYLQETYSSKDIENIWRKQWKGDMLFSHGSSHGRGLLILVRVSDILQEDVESVDIIPSTKSDHSAITLDKVYSLPFRSTLESKTWEFQNKILNYIVFTNEKLYRLGLVASPICTFCQETAESIEHLLFSCKISSEFWKHVLSIEGVGHNFWEVRHKRQFYFNKPFIIIREILYLL